MALSQWSYRRGHLSQLNDDNHQAHQNIGSGHERHQEAGHRGDSLDAAQHHSADQHHQHQAGAQRGTEKESCKYLGHRIGLHGVGDAESGQAAEKGKGKASQCQRLCRPLRM